LIITIISINTNAEGTAFFTVYMYSVEIFNPVAKSLYKSILFFPNSISLDEDTAI
jgi:hypothetical protein